jgi:hypothetical protein
MLLEQVTCLSPQSIAEPRNRRSEFTSSPIYCSSCSQIHRRPMFTWMRALSRPKAPSMRRPPTTRHLHPALAGMVRGRDSQMILFAGTWVGSSRFPYLPLWCSANSSFGRGQCSGPVNAQYRLWWSVAHRSAEHFFLSHPQSGEFVWTNDEVSMFCPLYMLVWLYPICFDPFCTFSDRNCSTELLIHVEEVLGLEGMS